MYAVLVNISDNLYDVIATFSKPDQKIMDDLNAAYETGSPITAIDANLHKQTALYGATWNGSSFSGGTAGPRLLEATQEQLDSFDLYAFLCNNIVVARIAASVDSPKAEMFRAALATGMSMVKVPSNQSILAGQSYNWDGTSFSTPA